MARESHDPWLQEISDGRYDRVFRFALPGYILSLLSKAPVEGRRACLILGWRESEFFRLPGNNQLLMRKKLLTILALLTFLASALAQTGSRMKTNQTLPAGYWPLEKSQPIVDKTQTIRLAPDLSQLSAGERSAVAKLLEVGKIFQSIYEDQRHKQALSSYRELVQLDKRVGSTVATQNLLTLYRLNQGPIAAT